MRLALESMACASLVRPVFDTVRPGSQDGLWCRLGVLGPGPFSLIARTVMGAGQVVLALGARDGHHGARRDSNS